MSKIQINEADKAAVLRKIQTYFADELEHEIGRFEAEFLLGFLEEQLGALYYNQGLYDAQAMLARKVDTLAEAIAGLEKPVP